MFKQLKKKIRGRIKKKFLKMPIVPTDRSNIPASLNENFNRVLALNPRVTSFQEHVALFTLSSMVKGSIIEVGCYLCYSSILMASAFRSPDRKLYAIDLFDREKGWKGGGTDSWIYRDFSQQEFAEKIVADSGFQDTIKVIQGPSGEVVDQVADIPDIGMIFIDGDHSHEGCMKDLLSYAPLVSAGGLLVMDDYAARSHPGVKSAVDEYLSKHSEFEVMFLLGQMLVLKKQD